jgi:hypothetical protein
LPQIQVWINNDNPENVEKLVSTLNEAMVTHKEQKLKAFMIFVTTDAKALAPKLTSLADKNKAEDIMLAHIEPSNEAVDAYKVNVAPEIKNTIMLYRKKTVTSKHVNLKADEKGLAELKASIADLLK